MQQETEQAVRKLLNDSKASLSQMLSSLDKQIKEKQRDEMCTKLKIVIGLIRENNGEELEEEVKEFGDPDLLEAVKGVKERLGAGGMAAQMPSKSEAKPETKPAEKRADRIKQVPKNKKNDIQTRSESIFRGVLEKLKIKPAEDANPNVKKMILPENQQRHYFDPVKGKYVFQGQEQEEVKQPSKPPPAAKLLSANASKKKEAQTKKLNPLQQMMAPAPYKRKGQKKKQQTTKQIQAELSFEKLQQQLTNQVADTTQKLLSLFTQQLENTLAARPAFPTQTLATLKNFSDEIRAAQEISDTMMTRLFSSYIDSEFDNALSQNLLEQILNLEKTNMRIMSACWGDRKIGSQSSLEGKEKESGLPSASTLALQQQKAKLQDQLKSISQQTQLLKLENQKLKNALDISNKSLNDERQKYRLNLQSQVSENKMVKLVIEEKKNEIAELERAKMLREEECGQYKAEILRKRDQARGLTNQIKFLQSKLSTFETNIQAEQQQILKLVLKKSSQQTLLQQINSTLEAQNDLYSSIQAKRMNIFTQDKDKHIERADRRWGNGEDQGSTRGSLFQLSDSLSRIVDFYQGQLAAVKRQCASTADSYQALRSESSRIQQNLTAQNLSLQRSVTRLKSLLQDHKHTKQTLQIKTAQLQNDNQALQRQLTHLRKQHSYTKQILEQNIRASHDNTATLKEQLQAEIKGLEEQLENKERNQRVLDQELKEGMAQINELIKENKIKGNKIVALERDIKGLRDQWHELELEGGRKDARVGELERQLEALGSKLAEEKTKSEAAIKGTKLRMKELNEEIGAMRNQVKMARREKDEQEAAVEEFKRENEEMLGILEGSNSENERLKAENEQLLNNLEEKHQQIEQLTASNSEYAKRMEQVAQNQEYLLQQLQTQRQQISTMLSQLQSYKTANQEQVAATHSLSQHINHSNSQLHSLQQELLTRVHTLSQHILSNQKETQQLYRTSSAYEDIVRVLGEKLEALETGAQAEEEVQGLRDKVVGYQKEIEQLLLMLDEREDAEELRAKVEELEREKETWKRMIDEKDRAIKQALAQLPTLQSKLLTLQEQRNTFQQITIQMQTQISTLTQTLSSTQHQLQTKSAQNSQLRKSNQLKEKEIEILATKVGEVEGGLGREGEMRDQMGELERKIEKVVDEKNLEILRRDKKIEELEDAIAQLEQFKNQHQDSAKVSAQQSLKLADLENDLKESDQLISDLSAKLEQNQGAFQQREKQYREKEQSFEETINRLLEKLGRKEEVIQSQQKKITGLNQQVIKLTREPSEKSNKSISLPEQTHTGPQNMKDKLITNIQSTKDEMHKKFLQIERLTKLLETRQLQLIEANRVISENNGNIESLLLELEEKSKENQGLGKRVQELMREAMEKGAREQKEKSMEIKSSESLSEQTQQLQMLIMAQDKTVNQQKTQIDSLTQQLQSTRQSLAQALKQKSQLHDLYIQKSEQADRVVEKLEAELREAKKMEAQVEHWQGKFKDLELENSELLVEKSELLKTKNEIMGRLAMQMQMHGQIEGKQNGNSPGKPIIKQQQSPTTQTTKRQPQPQLPKPSGFLSSLSSLFLTPTENEKIIKGKK